MLVPLVKDNKGKLTNWEKWWSVFSDFSNGKTCPLPFPRSNFLVGIYPWEHCEESFILTSGVGWNWWGRPWAAALLFVLEARLPQSVLVSVNAGKTWVAPATDAAATCIQLCKKSLWEAEASNCSSCTCLNIAGG